MTRNVPSNVGEEDDSAPQEPLVFEGETLRHSPHLLTLLRKRIGAYLDEQ
jgi:hypothetical protein